MDAEFKFVAQEVRDFEYNKAMQKLIDNSEKYITTIHKMIEEIVLALKSPCRDEYIHNKISEIEDLLVEESFRCFYSGIVEKIYNTESEKIPVMSTMPDSLISAIKAIEHG